MERRGRGPERRRATGLPLPEERRLKSRRKARNFVGSRPPERNHIDVNEEYDVRYWTEELGVSADELKSAVQTAGPSVKAVRKHLGKQT